MPAKITAELKAMFETRSGYRVASQGKTLYFDLQCFSALRNIDEYQIIVREALQNAVG